MKLFTKVSPKRTKRKIHKRGRKNKIEGVVEKEIEKIKEKEEDSGKTLYFMKKIIKRILFNKIWD